MNFEDWARSIPPVTKAFFFSAAAVTLIGNFGIINPFFFILSFKHVFYEFQIWRLVTSALFFGKLGFPFLINMYFLYNYSKNIETGLFHQKTADYVYMLVVVWLILILVGFLMPLSIIGTPIVFAIVHVWCHTNPQQELSFWFGTRFKAMYFPWVLWGFSILTGKSGIPELIGIFSGHVYFFLKFKWPELGGPTLLNTPQFISNLFNEQAPGVTGFGGRVNVNNNNNNNNNNNQGDAAAPRNLFGGRGHVLGN